MQEQVPNRITIEISDELKRAISLRSTMRIQTQKKVLHDALMEEFKPELELLKRMEKDVRNDKP